MANLSATGQRVPSIPNLHDDQFIIADTTDFSSGGWVPDKNPRNLADNEFVTAKGVCYIAGRLISINSSGAFDIGGTQPDNNKILNIFNYTSLSGVAYTTDIYRFTKDKIYKLVGGAWVNVPPNAIAANTGGDKDYFSFAVVPSSSTIYFANGIDPIRQLTAVPNYVAVGDAPAYKYITSAFDRLIGFNLSTAKSQIGWSGQNNFTEFNSGVDISAGNSILSSTSTDGTDDGTGIFNYASYLLLPRLNSVWIAQHQNSATAPFVFSPLLPDLGMDTPRTIQRTEHGLIWYSFKYNKVFFWSPPNGTPEDFSNNIRFNLRLSTLLAQGQYEVFAKYNPSTAIYSLFLFNGANATTEFQYNLNSRTWCQVDRSSPAEVFNPVTAVGLDRTKTPMLSYLGSFGAGLTGGSICQENITFGEDNIGASIATPKLTLLHKLYELPYTDTNFEYVNVQFRVINSGDNSGPLILTVYKNGVAFRTKSLTIMAADIGLSKSIQIKKSTRAKNIQIQLSTVAASPSIELTRLTIIGSKAGISRTGVAK